MPVLLYKRYILDL